MLIDDIWNIKSGKKDLRNFAIVIGAALAIIGTILLLKKNSAFLYLYIAAGIILLLGFFIPFVLKPLQKAWMILAVIMGWFVSRIILVILFFVILSSISLIARLFRKQFLNTSMKEVKDSYWHIREKKKFIESDYERQF